MGEVARGGQVGGSGAAEQLAGLRDRSGEVPPITAAEFQLRRGLVSERMRQQDVGALVLTAGSNLLYFTGVDAHPSERLTAAIMMDDGSLTWITPAFEAPRLRLVVGEDAPLLEWQEEEDPFALVAVAVRGAAGRIAVDETAPYWMVDRITGHVGSERCMPATPFTSGCRRVKSPAELAIIQHVMNLTLEVQRRTALIMRAGITASEVRSFINEAHLRLAGAESTFCIVSFGETTAYPHGGSGEQVLRDGDMVLVDTGTSLHGYKSDITRTYVFGRASSRQREVWSIEREAQHAAFDAARIGAACEDVDHAARVCIARHGFGPNYEIPGLPHRTGHGLGLDLHEHPYIVRGNGEALREGMCFSNEPMICIYGEFGVRLEDHIYMAQDGPRWFTKPSESIERPFADEVGALA